MQEKTFFLVKKQQVECEKMRIRWGLTGKEEARIWNYEENRKGSGCFFETPVQAIISLSQTPIHDEAN
jgi:hypothetical protein